VRIPMDTTNGFDLALGRPDMRFVLTFVKMDFIWVQLQWNMTV